MTGISRTQYQQVIRRIIGAYSSRVVRAYARVRMQIIRSRHLEEIAQYFPDSGSVLDVGCGFGLISLYFGLTRPGLTVYAMDLNQGRVAAARQAAERLGVSNVIFDVGDARSFQAEEAVDAAYLVDLIHHIPPAAVEPLLSGIRDRLAPMGYLIIKDIDSRPWPKVAFTWLLDKLVDYRAPVHYWSREQLQQQITSCGFTCRQHLMADYLPYPHVIYVGQRTQ